MQLFHSRRKIARIFVISFAVVLSGCGLPNVGAGVAQDIAQGLGCVISSAFDFLGPAMQLEMEQTELSQLTQFISSHGITTADQFWTQLDAKESARLQRLISEGYADLDSDSSLRNEPKSFYQDLFAYGLTQIATGNYPGDDYKFIGSVGVRGPNAITYTSYSIELSIQDASQSGEQSIGQCQ